MKGTEQSCNTGTGQCLDVKCISPYISELKEKDPCHPLAHRGSSTVGEGHQEHHRGPGTMCLQHCSWGQLLKGKILLQEKEREHHVTFAGIMFWRLQLLKTPHHLYPCSSTAPRCQGRNHPLPQWHQNPAYFVGNGGGARARNPESAEQPQANKGGLEGCQEQMAGNT